MDEIGMESPGMGNDFAQAVSNLAILSRLELFTFLEIIVCLGLVIAVLLLARSKNDEKTSSFLRTNLKTIGITILVVVIASKVINYFMISDMREGMLALMNNKGSEELTKKIVYLQFIATVLSIAKEGLLFITLAVIVWQYRKAPGSAPGEIQPAA